MHSDRANLTVKKEHLQQLVECSIVTGRGLESLVDEMFETFLECDASALMEEKAAQVASA